MPTATTKPTGPGLLHLFDGAVIWGSDDTYLALASSSLTVDADLLDYWDDISGVTEVTGTNWPAGGVQADGETLSLVTASDRVEFDLTDESTATVTLSDGKHLIIYTRTPGTNATREIIGYGTFDTALAPAGGTLLLDFPTTGVWYVPYV